LNYGKKIKKVFIITRHHFVSCLFAVIHILVFLIFTIIIGALQLCAMELEPSTDARNALWRDVTSKQSTVAHPPSHTCYGETRSAMADKSEDGQEQTPPASDLQIYQLLSSIKTDSPFYLPQELVQTITIHAHTNTTLCCYEKHKACVDDIKSLLCFIKSQAEDGIESTFTANIVQICLAYSGKSLCTIRNRLGETAFHTAIEDPHYGQLKTKKQLLYCIDVLCQAAGKDIFQLLYMEDNEGFTAWQHAIYFARSAIVKKFITRAGDRISELILMHNNYTALDAAHYKRDSLLTWISTLQYTGNVFKYWEQINELNIIIELLKPYYKKLVPSNTHG